MANTNPQEPIDLRNFAVRMKDALARTWLLVLALTLALGGLNYYRAKRSFVPMYEATAVFTVDAGYTADDIFSNSAYQDQYAARQMANSFQQILGMDVMRDLVIQQLPGGYINGVATATAVADSNLLVLRVQSSVAQDAYDYLNAIIDCYPQVASYMATNPKVRIMQSAALPSQPYNQFSGTGPAVKGALIGLVAGLALTLLLALLRRTVQTTDELKSTVNLPIVVTLPKVAAKKRRKNAAPARISAESDPNMAESLRGLRVKVKKLLEAPEKKIVLLTSTIADEGKTTVAVNLACALKKGGHKVLLLDADLYSQSVARALGEKPTGRNLLDCLRDPDISILDLIRTAQEQGLDYISGRNTDSRYYTINTKSLKQLLEVLTMEYDYIVVDTAPCEVISDTAALCRCADCVLYVVRQNHATSGQIINAVTSLHGKDVHIDGCIFNGVPQSQRQYGYGYGYGYGYRYRKYGYSKYSGYDKK